MEAEVKPYVLEVSWGCPSEKYPIHGVFQFDQAKALHEAGESVVFLALDLRSIRRWRKWGVNRREYRGIPVYEYNFPCGPMPPAIKYRIQDHAFKRAIRAIEKEFGKPRLIHIHTCQQAISEVDYCRRNDIPYFITEHITPLDETAPIESRKRDALHGAACVICVSNALGRDIKSTYDVDFTVIPNIVDLSDFRYTGPETVCTSDSMQGSPHITRIISAGRVDRGKGFDILIRAYAELLKTHPNTQLTIMGDGAKMGEMRALAAELGLGEGNTPGTIAFTGAYLRSEFATKLPESDFFALASQSETFGIVYAEALAAGVPVIATKCGGPEDFLDDTNGIIVPVDDVEAFTEAMKTMIRMKNSYDSKAIADACRKRFSPETISCMLMGLFRQVITGH